MSTPLAPADRPTIHVVDDDVAVRRSLAFLLEAASFTVCVHASATGFLATPAVTGCLLVDYDMPGIGGLELLRRLRLRGTSLPCIVITGKKAAGMREAAQALGAAAVIEKPFDCEDLILTIRTALSPT
ncbi:response regulator [Mycobacterium sp. KBS0706]|uniref:response regulator n=1 Tax=Mycobacterium sp. KBS0706 TaxID=2578109 RepID=UPI00110FCB5B|nr:response regulator [Mycobacterium sp. KBS0706]TSD85482.1 response regulator [Mycobacterium sp. KBS0706]